MTPQQIGDQPAFPPIPSPSHYGPQGMTYRQWLIGQALAGKANASDDTARDAIRMADTVLNRLAIEANATTTATSTDTGASLRAPTFQ